MKYVAVDIGCIECGEPSFILGIFDQKADAEAACCKASSLQKDYWYGEHVFEIHGVPEENVETIPDYKTLHWEEE